MSFFGKNIKKIRSVKGLSQQSFADLFDLKRGTLGAYEEGRSEPKIETIIKIANYFSIIIDDLLTNELTVNQLLKFKDNVVTNISTTKKEIYRSIPCINDNNIENYILNGYNNFLIQNNSFLKLPINTEKELLAYTIKNLEMSVNEGGFLPNDIVIGEKIDLSTLDNGINNLLALVVLENKVVFRRVLNNNNEVVLKTEHKGISDLVLNLDDIKEVWKIKYVFFKHIPEFSNVADNRFFALEKKIDIIYQKVK